jgi:hypothetical protein
MERFKYILKRLFYTMLVSVIYLTAIPKLADTENLVITTYYPAPYGGYVSLLTTNNTWLARDGGSVGIGTTAPAGRLDVRGRLALSGLESPNYGGASAGVAIIGTPNSGGGLLFRPTGLDSTNGEVLFRSGVSYFSGSVGIGTSNPLQTLDVRGNVLIAGNLMGLCNWRWKRPSQTNTDLITCPPGEVSLGIAWTTFATEHTCIGNAYVQVTRTGAVTSVCTYGTKTVPVGGWMLCCRIQ